MITLQLSVRVPSTFAHSQCSEMYLKSTVTYLHFLQSIAPPGGQIVGKQTLAPLLLSSARGCRVQNEELRAIRQIDSLRFLPDLVCSLITWEAYLCRSD